jgi:hypothetical protein
MQEDRDIYMRDQKPFSIQTGCDSRRLERDFRF